MLWKIDVYNKILSDNVALIFLMNYDRCSKSNASYLIPQKWQTDSGSTMRLLERTRFHQLNTKCST